LHLLSLLVWAIVAVYGVACLAIITVAGVGWAWGLLPASDPEKVARQGRIAADRETVRQGKVPGV
jgi:hypothetical protein